MICWPDSTLVPSMRTTTGIFTCRSFCGGTTPWRERRSENAAEDVDEDGLYARSLRRCGSVFDLFGGSAAATSRKFCR